MSLDRVKHITFIITVSQMAVNNYFVNSFSIHIQAYYRRASANMALGKFKDALKDFKYVSKFTI